MPVTFWDAFQHLRVQLGKIYEPSESEFMAGRVIETLSGFSKTHFILNRFEHLNPEQENQLAIYTKELLANRPLQYVLGTCYFYGLTLAVDESVLIPRPETEELVDWCLAVIQDTFASKNNKLQILDIGTGSGCIALALKSKLPEATVYAVDVSPNALTVARKNSDRLNLPVHFLQLDILAEKEWQALPQFDLIVSNPPYITPEEKTSLSPTVLDYEPHEALFVTDHDPLQFYRKIEAFSTGHLKNEGRLFLELHARFSRQALDLYQQKGWKTFLKKDMQGLERMLMAFP